MALSRGLRCCQRVFSWIPVLIITAVVLWSYYAYVFALCLCEYYTIVLCVLDFFRLRSRKCRRLSHSRVDKITLICFRKELAKQAEVLLSRCLCFRILRDIYSIKAIPGICHCSVPVSLRCLASRSVIDTKTLWFASHGSLEPLFSNRCFTLIRRKI